VEHVVNVQELEPDDGDERSLRGKLGRREEEILRDTYWLISPEDSPSRRLKIGHTTIYPTGRTTGHAHDDREEVYYVVAGKGVMKVGDDEFEIGPGDAFYVPPGEYHVTWQRGNVPLTVVWVTCRLDEDEVAG
jgi:mannose-6-phosphate isomerase-like protein (cupin superfamily)